LRAKWKNNSLLAIVIMDGEYIRFIYYVLRETMFFSHQQWMKDGISSRKLRKKNSRKFEYVWKRATDKRARKISLDKTRFRATTESILARFTVRLLIREAN